MHTFGGLHYRTKTAKLPLLVCALLDDTIRITHHSNQKIDEKQERYHLCQDRKNEV